MERVRVPFRQVPSPCAPCLGEGRRKGSFALIGEKQYARARELANFAFRACSSRFAVALALAAECRYLRGRNSPPRAADRHVAGWVSGARTASSPS